MNLFALVRPPTASLSAGERTFVPREPVDFAKATTQHAQYVDALREAGADILFLPAAEHLPDAVFVEDTALVLDEAAVIARSGAASRRPETAAVTAALNRYRHLAQPPDAATFEGGDVLVIDRTLYIGLSERTNAQAIDYFHTLLRGYDYRVVPVPVSGCLHLKSAVTYLGNNTILLNAQWVPRSAFTKHTQIFVDPMESMAANALRVGDHLLMSASYPVTMNRVATHGFQPRAIDISEFHRAEGGLTCLSILFRSLE